MNTSFRNLLLSTTLFSIAMGYLESAVVVYLRELYYPDGFRFPLVPIEPHIAVTEFWREAATIIMLAGIGYVAGKNRTERCAWFIYCFGVWDIFYYVFLKALINWPESLLTWDILFLIPVPWVGPVLAPCLVSLTLIVFALVILTSGKRELRIKSTESLLWAAGCLIIIFSFMFDYIAHVLGHHSIDELWSLSLDKKLFQEALSFVPSDYNWFLFILGEILMVAAAVRYLKQK
jgi:hypothetical protein